MVDIYVGQPQRTRALGNLALRQGMQGGPVYHPLQALGQLAQTAAGIYLSRKADQQEQQRQQQAQSALMGLLQGGTQTATAGQTPMAMPGGAPGQPDLMALVSNVQQFPELAGVLNPMITAQFTPQKPLVLGEGDVAFDPRTQQEIARGPEAAPKFSTDYGKAIADAQLAEETFGKDSPQAAAFREMAQAERTGGGEIDLSDEAGQRKEFTKASGDFIKVRDAFGKIQKAKPTAAGDLALIFNYMKLLDPGSVVREGEFATAQNTAGVPDRVRNTYNRLLSGERLNPTQRENFKSQAGDVFIAQRDQQNLLEDEFGRIAGASGLRPQNVIVDFQGPLREYAVAAEEPAPEEAAPEIQGGEPLIGSMGGQSVPGGFAATAVNEAGEVIVWDGQKWINPETGEAVQ